MKSKLKPIKKNTKKFQTGGVTPIITNDPNDPRLKAYDDSLKSYTTGLDVATNIGKSFDKALFHSNKQYENYYRKNYKAGKLKYPLDGNDDRIYGRTIPTNSSYIKELTNWYNQNNKEVGKQYGRLNTLKVKPTKALESAELPQIQVYKKPVQLVQYQEPTQQISLVPQEQPKPNGDHYQPTQYPNVQMVTTKDGKRFYENKAGQRMNYGTPPAKDYQYQGVEKKAEGGLIRKYGPGGYIAETDETRAVAPNNLIEQNKQIREARSSDPQQAQLRPYVNGKYTPEQLKAQRAYTKTDELRDKVGKGIKSLGIDPKLIMDNPKEFVVQAALVGLPVGKGKGLVQKGASILKQEIASSTTNMMQYRHKMEVLKDYFKEKQLLGKEITADDRRIWNQAGGGTDYSMEIFAGGNIRHVNKGKFKDNIITTVNRVDGNSPIALKKDHGPEINAIQKGTNTNQFLDEYSNRNAFDYDKSGLMDVNPFISKNEEGGLIQDNMKTKLKPVGNKAKIKLMYAGGGLTPDAAPTAASSQNSIMDPVIAPSNPIPKMQAIPPGQVTGPANTQTLAGSKGVANNNNQVAGAKSPINNNVMQAGYGAVAGASTYTTYQDDPNLSKQNNNAKQINNTVQSGVSSGTPWGQIAYEGKSLGEGTIKRNEYGTGKNSQEKQRDALFKPHHEFVVNDVTNATDSEGNRGTISRGVATAFVPGIGYETQSDAFGLKDELNSLFGVKKDPNAVQNRKKLVNPFTNENQDTMYAKHGGPTDGSKVINAEQDELIVDPKSNKTIKDLKNLPPHPENENLMDPDGNIAVTKELEGKLVIPNSGKNGREAWLTAKASNDKLALNRIKRNLINKQKINEAKEQAANTEAMYAKEGGAIHLRPLGPSKPSSWKFQTGGLLGRYDKKTIIPEQEVTGLVNNPLLNQQYASTVNPWSDNKYNSDLNADYTKTYQMDQTAGRPTSTSSTVPTKTIGGTSTNPSGYGLSGGQNLALAGLNNAGNLYALGNAIFNKEKTKKVENPFMRSALDLMANRRYNIDPLLRSNEQTYRSGEYATRNDGSQGQAQYQSNLTSQLTRKYMADNLAHVTKQNADLGYAGEEGQMKFAAGEAQRGEGVRVQTANEQNKARRQDQIGTSLGAVGRNLTQQSYDNARLRMLPTMFAGANNDPEMQKIINQMVLFGFGTGNGQDKG